jgi:hypothetical protein
VLDELALSPDDVLFVGDTWSCDVEGPRASGIRAVYIRREHFGPDHTAPGVPGGAAHADGSGHGDPTDADDVPRVTTLHPILTLPHHPR